MATTPAVSDYNAPVFQQGQSAFNPVTTPANDLISLQIDPVQPVPTSLTPDTGMVLPNVSVAQRMAHFPQNLYDVSPSSHLTKFLKAMLGEAGGGQLRKRNFISTLQNTMQGSNFYDLDGFYGAIFNANRSEAEVLGSNNLTGAAFNPVSDTAVANEWDQIQTTDASYKQRIFQLAAAINLGATYDGIKRAAEAIVQGPVDVFEVWDLLDAFGGAVAGRQWLQVQQMDTGNYTRTDTIPASQTGFMISDGSVQASDVGLYVTGPGIPNNSSIASVVVGTSFTFTNDANAPKTAVTGDTTVTISAGAQWGQIEQYLGTGKPQISWQQVEASVQIGRTGINNRAEVLIAPRVNYDTTAFLQGDTTGQRQRIMDSLAMTKVLDVLKPAGVLLTFDMTGAPLYKEAALASFQADSNFWYISSRVTPNPALNSPSGEGYPTSIAQTNAGIGEWDPHEIPKPLWGIQQQAHWSYATEINRTQAYSFDGYQDPNFGVPTRDAILNAQGYTAQPGNITLDGTQNVIATTDQDLVTYLDSSTETFGPDRGVMTAQQALALRYAAEGIISSAPYARDRIAAIDGTAAPVVNVPNLAPVTGAIL